MKEVRMRVQVELAEEQVQMMFFENIVHGFKISGVPSNRLVKLIKDIYNKQEKADEQLTFDFE